MSAIALRWKDFHDTCYRRRPLPPELAREYRMLFYAGFHACQTEFALMSIDGLDSAEMRANIKASADEFDRFVKQYLEERG